MSLTGSMKTTAVAGAALLAAGLPVTAHSSLHHDTARAVGGLCLIVTALFAIGMVFGRTWMRDTRDERRDLARARQAASEEHHTYIAAKALLECEQIRLNRDLNAERRALAVRLTAEREALAAEFEERRSALIAETVEATILMVRSGKPAPGQSSGNLIPFPKQQPEHERSQERGAARP